MNQKNIIWGLLVICILSVFGFSGLENRFKYIFNRLEQYSKEQGPEKIYIHTDKKYYTNGETIWLKSYLVDGVTHKESTKSKVLYVELINPEDSIVSRRTLYVDSIGASGDIQIGKDWKEGNYLLRSYTNYMRNAKNPIFFQKEIPIWYQEIKSDETHQVSSDKVNVEESTVAQQQNPEKQEKPSIKFYPEGGDLISGLENTMGIHAKDSSGNGVALKGHIEDENGNIEVYFRTYKYGLGKTTFTPQLDKKYFANVVINDKIEKYPIPNSLINGYTLNVQNIGDRLVLNVASNNKSGLNGTLLVGHLRGELIFKHIEEETKDNYSIQLLVEEFGDGVAHFTLFTPSGAAVCERLTFIDNPDNDVDFKVVADKEKYATRDKVSLDISLNDTKGIPVQGDFSMSITTSAGQGAGAEDIRTWLLLNSDLKGTIENPGFFFEKTNEKNRKYLLDALMLTHGWRRFVWKEFLHERVDKTLKYPVEKGIFIKGKTTVFEKPFATKKTMTTINFLNDGVYQEKKLTNDQGQFHFGPFVFRDSINTIIEAAYPDIDDKEKSRELSIHIDAPIPVPTIERFKRKQENNIYSQFEQSQEYLEESRRKKVTDFIYNDGITQLEDVFIKGKKKKTIADKINDDINSQTPYGSARTRLFIDSIPGIRSASVIDVLTRVPGVRVFGVFPDQSVQVRGITSLVGSSDPLFLIDGGEVPLDFVSGMLASEISFIDVLVGGEAAIYGTRGANGVIALYTYRGFSYLKGQDKFPGVTNFVCPGFYQAREFFTPDYSTKNPEQIKPDYRTTLHWEPDIYIDGQNKQPVTFYTNDIPGKYIVKVEGVTYDGRLVHSISEITIKE